MNHQYVDLSGGAPDEEDVHDALAYLISVEPYPPPPTYDDYKAAIAPYEAEIGRAIRALRAYAERMQPATLEAMRERFYGFINDERYLDYADSTYVVATVTAYLNEAWDGVGPPWRR